ncbi:MAG: hypothetical protein AAGI63_07825, partial [Planctomycetota bacterium]
MKSSTSFLLLTLLFCPNGLAAETSTHSLWPSSSLPHDGKGDVPELIVTQVDSDQPTAGIVILPGGGYRGHAMDHEGHQFAKWFADRGVTSAICTYRLRGKG